MARFWMQFCAASIALSALTKIASAQPAPPPAPDQPKPGAAIPGATQPGYPGAQPGYPQAQPGYPGGQPGYPQAQPGYPGGQPGYPQAQPGYPGGQPGYPQAQPGYPPPGYGPQPGYGQYPPGYGQYPQQQGYPPGSYPPPGYMYPPPGSQYGYQPPPGPPPPPTPKASSCCRWSVRFNPVDLIFRKLTFEGEVAIIGPLSIEVTPSWIFGSPYDFTDQKGLSIGMNVAVYVVKLKAFQGMWIKGHFAYENFTATAYNPDDENLFSEQRLASAVLGGMIGGTWVWGSNGGFIISGGGGLGVALADPVPLIAPGDPIRGIPAVQVASLYENFDKLKLLGTLGLGVAF